MRTRRRYPLARRRTPRAGGSSRELERARRGRSGRRAPPRPARGRAACRRRGARSRPRAPHARRGSRPGPTSATGSPSIDHRRARRRAGGRASSPGSPCSTRYSPFLTVRISGLAPPRMIVTDSWRSSAVSTAVTSAFESCVAPRRVLAERVAVPVLEVGEPDLGRELAVGVVDPVPRELARAEHLEARRCRRRGW